MKIRIYYEDTDTGGVVYHSNYINFCERARSEAFFKKGLSPALDSGHFVAKKLEANYIKSAKLGDELNITTELLEMRAASFKLLQKVYKEDIVIFKLEITLAYITFEGKPQKITNYVKELILSLF
ncbi:MAG: YbgC/FadM family acyl-CoA thioesterase [Epsilonproteobacteria bacterium]|nr:YbgC/FadM family acyl-CoA thioesterase [Campylobacterota bacterium]